MIEGRELAIDDYVAMLRRRAKVILIPTLLAPLAGYMVSRGFTPKYTSQSLVLVEGQKVPEAMVQPVVSEDLTARVATLQQQVLSQTNLQAIVGKVFPGKNSQEAEEIIDNIRANMTVEPVITTLSAIGTTAGKPVKPGQSPVPGFYVNYTASRPREAQQICDALTSSVVEENLKLIDASAKGTTEVLNQGIEDAKHNLDDLDAKLAEFKKKYVGQLPGDEENNLKILMGLNTQLDANTQTLNRAQQDKSFTESLLAQQLAAWKSAQSLTTPQTLEKQIAELQSQLLQLQARYTEDHPDVIKVKADLAELKKKLAEINSTSGDATDTGTEKAARTEPLEIKQLRLQLHQYEDVLSAATRNQTRLQKEISTYQGEISLSPGVEAEYKQLTRDYYSAQKSYQDLLAKKSTADLTVKMNNQAEGERMFPLNPADLPDAPSFPNPLFFAAGGLGAGLALGAALAGWLEVRDKSIRTEADAEAALELPMLVAMPWVEATTEKDKKIARFWRRNKKPDLQKDRLTA